MRISDWSSDVCSSDLLFVLNIVSTKSLPILHESPYFLVRSGAEMCPDHRSNRRHWFSSGARIRPCRHYNPYPAGPQCGAVARVDSHLQRPGHARDFRSEEHTSELQSLMRISYADL